MQLPSATPPTQAQPTSPTQAESRSCANAACVGRETCRRATLVTHATGATATLFITKSISVTVQ